MFRVAISGKANSGKDTVSRKIGLGLCGPDNHYYLSALADPIKTIVQNMFPLSNHNDLWGASELRAKVIPGSITTKKPEGITYRKVLCDVGALGRSYDEDRWIKVFLENFEDRSSKDMYKTYICSDVRFTNEFEVLKALGFYTIRIIRDSYLRIDDISEISQDSIPDSSFDKIIDNNGSLEFLEEQCNQVVSELQGK